MNLSIFSIAIFFLVGVGMAAVPIVLSFLLWEKPKQVTSYKLQVTSKELEPYESGMPPVGPGRMVGFEFFIYTILFLLFDVIAVLLFLGVMALRGNKLQFMWPFMILLGLSLLIILYGVRKREYLKI